MYTAILVWLFFAVWMAFSWYKDKDAKDTPIWGKILITVWGAAAVGVVPYILITMVLTGAIAEYEPRLEETVYIVSTKDNVEVSGHGNGFIATRITIESNVVYTMYAKSQHGFYAFQIPANQAVIKYDTGKPRVLHYREYPTNSIKNKFTMAEVHGHAYVIYVPPNSIETEYKFDAE
jgi:hypothetical protein